MHRAIRFFLHSTIAVFCLFVITFTIQLVLHAPMPVGGRIAGLQLHSVFIPGKSLTCTQTERGDRCQITLFDRPLEINLLSAPFEVRQCQLSYAGQTASCTGDFNSLILGGWQPVIVTNSYLGLTATQQAQLREAYPQRNVLLHQVGESRLLQLANGTAIAAGILTVLFGLLNLSRPGLSIGLGFLVLINVWIVLTAMLWGLGYVD